MSKEILDKKLKDLYEAELNEMETRALEAEKELKTMQAELKKSRNEVIELKQDVTGLSKELHELETRQKKPKPTETTRRESQSDMSDHGLGDDLMTPTEFDQTNEMAQLQAEHLALLETLRQKDLETQNHLKLIDQNAQTITQMKIEIKSLEKTREETAQLAKEFKEELQTTQAKLNNAPSNTQFTTDLLIDSLQREIIAAQTISAQHAEIMDKAAKLTDLVATLTDALDASESKLTREKTLSEIAANAAKKSDEKVQRLQAQLAASENSNQYLEKYLKQKDQEAAATGTAIEQVLTESLTAKQLEEVKNKLANLLPEADMDEMPVPKEEEEDVFYDANDFFESDLQPEQMEKVSSFVENPDGAPSPEVQGILSSMMAFIRKHLVRQ